MSTNQKSDISNDLQLNNDSAKQIHVGFLLGIAGTILFSLKSIFVKLAYMEGIDATSLMFMRMSIAFPFYLVVFIYALKTRPEKAALLNKQLILASFALGFLGYYLASYFDFESLQHISAQLERLVLFTYPIMVAILGWIFFREKITATICISMVLSYIGISFLFFNESGAGNVNIVKGTLLVTCSAFFFSFYVVFSKRVMSKLGSLLFTSLAMCSAVFFIFIHFFATRDLSFLEVSPRIWLLAFLLAIFCTLIPSFLVAEAVNRIGATKMSITGSIGPVVTIIIAVIFLGEDFGWEQIVGLCLVLTGVGLLKKKSS